MVAAGGAYTGCGGVAMAGGGVGRAERIGAASSIVVAPVSSRNISKKSESDMPW